MELLIAATMMSVLFVGLVAHLQGGVAVWRRTTETAQRLQRRRVALDRLERDAARAIVYDERDASYGTEPGLLPAPQFTGTELRWFTVAPASGQSLPAVRFVTYACEESGAAPGRWLVRTSQSLGDARAKRPTTPELLVPGCETLSLRYATQPSDPSSRLAWIAPWPDPQKRLPRLIELSIRFSSGDRITRMVAIAPGHLSPTGPPAS